LASGHDQFSGRIRATKAGEIRPVLSRTISGVAQDKPDNPPRRYAVCCRTCYRRATRGM
jgi:hypothetical protein